MKNFKKFAALAILFALVGCGGGVKSTGNNASTNSTNSGTNISTNSTNSGDKNSTNSTNSGNNSSTNTGNSSSNNGSSSGPSVDVDAEFLAAAAKKLVYSGLNTAGVSEDFNLITSLEEGLVTITYESSNTTYMTIDGNVAKISAPSIGTTEEGYVAVTLTAILTYKDKTVEKTFNVKINESRGKVEEGELVTNPVANTPYKLALTQENNGVNLYFKGEMNGYYYATTESASEAVDVVLVETDGGFHLTMNASGTTKYLNAVREMGNDGKEHNNVRIDDSAITVWTFNTEYNTLVTELADGKTYYLGTYNTYSTISASSIDKAATSFVSHLYTGAIPGTSDTPTPDVPVIDGEMVTNPVANTPYKLALTQENKGVELYFKGEMNGFYYATTENAAEAKDVVLVETDGGFHLTMDVNGATKYLNLVREMGTDGKEHNNVRIDDSAVTVWTFNTEYNTLVTELADGNTYYLGTYNTYSTISASTIDKAATSFVSHLYTVGTSTNPDTPTPDTPAGEGEMVTNPVANTPYKLALTQENKGVNLYFKGEMNGFYYATTENAAEAKDVVLVETDGGFHLTMDVNGATKYLNLVREMGTDGKEHNNVRIDDSAVTVWTFNTEYNTLVTDLADGNTYYLGTYGTYTTISASSIDKAASSFVSHLYTGSVPGTPDTPTPDTPVTPGETLTLPFEANINGSLPSNLTFISQYAAEFYSNGGLKVTKIDQGVLTAKFEAADNVKVTVNILKLNANQKSESSDTTDAFTVYGLNEAGEVVATASFNDVVVGDNTVTLAGEGIVQVKVVMTDYYSDGSVCYNISLGGISVAQA